MNYNELNFYHRNPYYKQDFLPDRAWYNREAKAYPSEIPSGKDFLPDNGRKHFLNRFNHSQIQQESILKSPQRFPFENRIAMEKAYMRNLNTIDIEGASTNSTMNQSVKNIFKARDHLARKFNHSVDLKQKTEEQKRREVALKHFESFKQKQSRIAFNEREGQYDKVESRPNNPENVESPLLQKDITAEYKKYVMHNSSNKYHKDIPLVNYNRQMAKNEAEYYQYHTLEGNNKNSPVQIDGNSPQIKNQEGNFKKWQNQDEVTSPSIYSKYKSDFNADKMRNSEQYKKILEFEEVNRRMMKATRKSNPTNLSLSLAGQNIISH